MEKKSNIGIWVVLLVAVALGSYQGLRINRMRDAERFYRWIITSANERRLPKDQEQREASQNKSKDAGAKLLAQVEKVTQPLLPKINHPLTKDDYDSEGRPYSKLVLAVKDGGEEHEIYSLAAGTQLAPQRKAFLDDLRTNKIFDPNRIDYRGIINPSNGNISLGTLFFGFRKMAANLVWLQVDEYWHEGLMFRMYPLMKTCVTLDPNFVEAFLLGAWHLSYNMTAGLPDTPAKYKQYDPVHKAMVGQKEKLYYDAIDFLKDGILNNPKNYQLYFDLGFAIYEEKMHDHYDAVQYLSEAIRHRHDQWVPRMLYRSMMLDGQYKDALAGWYDYRSKFPNSSKAVVARSIQMNKGLLKERDAEIDFDLADQEKALANKDRAQAAAAKTAADAARADNNTTEAQEQDSFAKAATEKAADAEAKAKQAEDHANSLYAGARAIWNKLNSEGGDPFAVGRLARMDAKRMIAKKEYREAIGLLDYARYQSNDFWNEGSNMIIKTKELAGIPLNLSERMEMGRRADAKKYMGKAPKQIYAHYYRFDEAHNAWTQEDYKGQATKPFNPSPEQFAELRREHVDLDKILALGAVTFQLGDVWYKYTPPPKPTTNATATTTTATEPKPAATATTPTAAAKPTATPTPPTAPAKPTATPTAKPAPAGHACLEPQNRFTTPHAA